MAIYGRQNLDLWRQQKSTAPTYGRTKQSDRPVLSQSCEFLLQPTGGDAGGESLRRLKLVVDETSGRMEEEAEEEEREEER